MKIFKICAAAACAAAMCSAFAGCANGVVKVESDDGSANYVFKVRGDVAELGDDTTLYDYMRALKERGELEFEAEKGDYGYYITSVEGVSEKRELDGVIYSSAEYGTWDYDGLTLNSARYGVDGMPAVEGCTYALVYSAWSY